MRVFHADPRPVPDLHGQGAGRLHGDHVPAGVHAGAGLQLQVVLLPRRGEEPFVINHNQLTNSVFHDDRVRVL